MAVSYKILKEFDVVYVKYVGPPEILAAIALFESYQRDPDCRPGQKHFVDLSDISEPVGDYIEMMKFMAKMADQFTQDSPQTLLVCYAPTPLSRKVAIMGQKSWDKVDQVVYRVIEDEAAALAFLGLTAKSVADLLADA
ncbi:hypothetical protein ACSBLW_04910 [Thioclava sp. FR2]|uniref:hypothetical protein n=1 Tax=Thioclava sp. FR2 TaxID=3445780 RepID=UPI003EC12275